ncbi:MAG: hypothetical protein LPK09_07665, partial [Hymenobacteraceae bacterium]|nr:hypothetical protein [Hymenobacteraceae bacterium]
MSERPVHKQNLPGLRLYLVAILVLLFGYRPGYGQSRVGIGGWQLHVPYTQGRAVAYAGDKVYLAAEQGLFYYDREFHNVQPITKADGLSEQRINTIGYDPETKTLVVAYANANIDLLQDNRVVNIPDILRRSGVEDKVINHIFVHNRTAYLASNFGVVVLDLVKQEIKDTYTNLGPAGENLPIVATTILGDSIFLATATGIRAANRLNSNLKDFRSWRQQNAGLPDGATITSIASFQNKVYIGTASHWLLGFQNGTWMNVPIPDGSAIRNLKASPDFLTAATQQGIVLFDKQMKGSALAHPLLQQPQQFVVSPDNVYWVADGQRGLVALGLNSDAASFAPSGPASGNAFRAYAGNGIVYVLSGGYDENYQPLNLEEGYYGYQNGTWHNNSRMAVPNTTTVMRDFVDAIYNPQTGHVYMATYGNGLLVWKGQEQPVLYNGTNSTLLSTQPASDKTQQVRLTDLAVDASGNVWTVNRHQVAGAPGLHVLRPDGEWQGYVIPGIADNGNLER